MKRLEALREAWKMYKYFRRVDMKELISAFNKRPPTLAKLYDKEPIKRSRGRPKKVVQLIDQIKCSEGLQPYCLSDNLINKLKSGRPKKVIQPNKRSRGRPKKVAQPVIRSRDI